MSKKNVPQRPAEPTTSHDEDELVHVPEGQSRIKFLLVLGLVIFVLLIFTVGSQLQGTVNRMFGGGGPIEPSMTWVEPDNGEKHEVDPQEFLLAKRSLDRLARLRLFQPRPTEDNPNSERASDEDVAMYLILGKQARDAGIMATDAEVKQRLGLLFESGDHFKRWAAGNRTTTIEVQEDVRELLSYQKYRNLLRSAVSVASPERVTELWAEQHPEYSFQYAVTDVAAYEEKARASAPADEVLLEWFHELPMFRQRSYYTDEMVLPEVAWLDLSQDFDSTALMTKYPRPEGEDLLALARAYYNQTSSIRFRNPKPELPEEGDPEEPVEPVQLFKAFEEVEELCKQQAPIHSALLEWLGDMKQRQEQGEEVDFAAEAAELGLTFVSPTEPLSRTALEEMPGWGGRFIGGQLAFGQANTFLSRVVHEEQAMIVGRVLTKTPGEEPPFDQIRDEIAEQWAADHAKVLATEALEAVRDQLGNRAEVAEGEEFLPNVDAETFASIVTAAGFEVQERPYLERNAVPDDDLANASSVDLFLRVSNTLYDLEVGDVAPAEANATGTNAFLVRLSGKRVADIDGISAQEISNLRRQVAVEASEAFDEDFMTANGDYAKERYQIHLRSWDAPEDEEL